VTKIGEYKNKGLVKCLKISNLQGLFVPRAGLLFIGVILFIIKGLFLDLKKGSETIRELKDLEMV